MKESLSSIDKRKTELSRHEALAYLLSQYLKLKGQAIPVSRFSMLEQGKGKVSLHDVDPYSSLAEMLIFHFPHAVYSKILGVNLKEANLSAIWISPAEDHFYLLKGRYVNGDCVAQTQEGENTRITKDEVDKGYLFVIEQLDSTSSALKEKQSVSAIDCFAASMLKRKSVYIEAIIASFVVSCLALFSALYTMQVYDRVIPTSGFDTLKILTVGVVLSVFFELLMKITRARIVDKASKDADNELSTIFFDKAVDIRLDARPQTVGTFASQIKQFESVRNFISSTTLFILADAPFAVFFIFVIYFIAGPLAYVPVTMLVVSLLVGYLTTRKMKEYANSQIEESNRKTGFLIEAIDGIESIKAAGSNWKLRHSYRLLNESLSELELKLKNISTRASSFSQSIQQFNYIGLVSFGAYLVVNGNLTMGGLIACSIISGRALTPISQVPTIFSQWCNVKISLSALNGIMKMPGEREPDTQLTIPDFCDGELQLQDVFFSFYEGSPVLDSINLSMKPGERIAIIGKVGSGKSTLIKILAGLFKASKGKACLDGVDMQQLAPDFIREHVGYLPQDIRLFKGTLRENLVLGLPSPSDSVIMSAARLTGLEFVIASHEKGLELPISEGGRGLSGGQRQLVGLTRMLIAKPKILLLDEPTASLDTNSEIRVFNHLFREILKDTLIVVVTHKPAILAHVDRVIVMDNAKIVLDDHRDKVLQLMKQGNKAPA